MPQTPVSQREGAEPDAGPQAALPEPQVRQYELGRRHFLGFSDTRTVGPCTERETIDRRAGPVWDVAGRRR